jgi:uncharacterized protein YjbJ (UPF0337 family)
LEDKAKGRMKEAAGAVTGDENKNAKGQAQQRKGAAGEEAAQKAKTRQTETEAREAERKRDRQHRRDKGGLFLGQRRRHSLRTLGTPALLYRGPESLRSFGFRPLHAFAFAELRRDSVTAKFAKFTFHALR